MTHATGYVLHLSPERFSIFEDCINEGLAFTEPVPDFSHSRQVPLICFVIVEGSLAHVALGRRGARAGTGLQRLNLKQIEGLTQAVPSQRILEILPKRLKASVEKRLTAGGLLTEKGFDAVVDAVRKLTADAGKLLDRFSKMRRERIRKLSTKAQVSLAYQKDALITALAIADIDDSSVQEWQIGDTKPKSFLEGLPSARLLEDQMIFNDVQHVPGFEQIRSYVQGAASFQSDSSRLTVVLANRLALEKQTGTDLIYYNETYRSFILVQYKAMESTSGEGAYFKLPNKQLTKEIARMDAMTALLNKCPMSAEPSRFRMNGNPFFLKFCSRTIFNPDDVKLLPGMYLPLDYWKQLASDKSMLGPRKGRRLTYENVGRSLNKRTFITLVAQAWIGTTPDQSSVLSDLFREIMTEGRAVALAVKPKQGRADDDTREQQKKDQTDE
jgi:hypothetical protein